MVDQALELKTRNAARDSGRSPNTDSRPSETSILTDSRASVRSDRAALLDEMRHSHRTSSHADSRDIRSNPTGNATYTQQTHHLTPRGFQDPRLAGTTPEVRATLAPTNDTDVRPVAEIRSTSTATAAPVKKSWREQWSENFSQMRSFVSNAWDSTVSAVKSIPAKLESAATWVKETGTWLGTRGREIAGKVYETLTDKEMWTNIGNKTLDILNTLSDPVALFNKATEWAGTAWKYTSEFGVATWNFLKDPQTWKSAWNGIVKAYEATQNFVVECIKDPSKIWEATKTVASATWGFVYDMGKSLGINDMLWGTVKFVEGVGRSVVAPFQFGASLISNSYSLLTGQKSFNEFVAGVSDGFNKSYGEVGRCFLESASAVKGAVVCLGELTGITDAAKCIYYTATGNYTMAAMHGAFALMSIGSIAATISTGGAAIGSVAAVAAGRKTAMEALKTFGKVALTNFAKEAAEAVGKDTGEVIVKKMTAELGQQLEQKILKTTETVVENSTSQLAKLVEKQGREALVGPTALANFEKLVYETSLPEAHKLLKELKIFDRVKAETLDLLKSLDSSSVSKVSDRLVSLGMSPEAARAAAKDLKTALRRGLSDQELAEVLAHQISEEISEKLIKHAEAPFREMMTKALMGTLDTPAGRELAEAMDKHGIKLSQKEIDDLVEAGWKGYRRAIKEATAEVCLKAVKEAFKEFRGNRKHLPHLNFRFNMSDIELPTSETEVFSAARIVVADRAALQKELGRPEDPGKRRITNRMKTTLLGETTETSETDTLA